MFLKSLLSLRLGKKRTNLDPPSKTNNRHLKILKRLTPRIETLLLLIGLACTVLGKFVVIQRQSSAASFVGVTQVVIPDILFFAAVALLISCLYWLSPRPLMARCAMVLAVLVAVWSVLNSTWLDASDIQLQPGVLIMLVRGINELWPILQNRLTAKLGKLVLVSIVVIGVGIYFLWRFYKPDKVVANRFYHTRRIVTIALVIIALLLIQPMIHSRSNLGFTGDVLGFSSHWYALVSTISDTSQGHDSAVQTRHIPRVGQRKIVAPQYSSGDLPNVVLVLLESVSYLSTSTGRPEFEAMPVLNSLARESAEFKLTRSVLPYTTKACWSVLTSTTPTVQPDYVEAVFVDQPYEGLPSLLARVGYRSAFFEVSKGSFECAPAFYHNLGFDWAWFRENLEDPSTNLGYVSGDDCKMIKPAFEWALKDSKPFFLMMITSVSHDPYIVPEWFGQPEEAPYDRYIQTLRYTDYFLEILLETLKQHGLEKKTILCILGDHGTSFRVRKGKGRWVPYEEVIRVPWIIRWPEHIESGGEINWPCSQLDVVPTILNLIGFDISEAGFDEGKDAFAPSDPNRRLYFSSWFLNSPTGFVEKNRKFVYWPYLEKAFEYNLDTDPKEENPKTLTSDQTEQINRDIKNWQQKTQIMIDPRRFTERFLYSHWRTFSSGRSAWAYYVPQGKEGTDE